MAPVLMCSPLCQGSLYVLHNRAVQAAETRELQRCQPSGRGGRCCVRIETLHVAMCAARQLESLRACRKYWLEAKESTKVTYRSCLQAWIRFIEWRRSLGHLDDFCVYPDTKASIQQRCVAALASKQPLTRVALLAGGAVPQVAPAGADSKQVKGPRWYCEEPPQRTAQVSSH
jgi:hypothetical protein